MRSLFRDLAAGLLVAAVIGVAAAAAQEAGTSDLRALVQACRADYRRFCAGMEPGNGAILTCLRQHADDLSQGCKDVVGRQQSRVPAGQSGSNNSPASTQTAASEKLPPGTEVLRDVAYGGDSRQRIDVYRPADAAGAASPLPILVMVHGGAWAFGDKASPGVVSAKANYWLGRNYIFVSVNNRLVPAADPAQQAADVAAAIAKVQAEAAAWHGDAARIVLMGHSAGAHLVALLAADPKIAMAAGAKPWLGTVALDSAAYDVPAIMAKRHAKFYDAAFGKDPAFWRQVSPIDQLAQKPMPLLLVCSTRRLASCGPAKAFAAKAVSLGGQASVLPEDLSHQQINVTLGEPGAYTDKVEAFMQKLGLP
ncbi:MAG TPA: alpha/beta hydrolase fold domain-containing protein [Terriglobia bacterium]|nr:alpha/beta hydrolase fold domain-containing protein [Terriglobia bacterium]